MAEDKEKKEKAVKGNLPAVVREIVAENFPTTTALATGRTAFIETLSQWPQIYAMGKEIVRSGLLPNHIKTAEQAAAIMLAGYGLGLDPWTAFQNIYVIRGNTTLSGKMQLAKIRASGLLEDIKIEDDGNTCTITTWRKGVSKPVVSSFSMEDARRIKMQEKQDDGSAKSSPLADKFNWRNEPELMRFYKAVSRNAKMGWSDITLGLSTPEDMGAVIDVEGRVISVPEDEPEPEKKKAPALIKVDTGKAETEEPSKDEPEPEPEPEPKPEPEAVAAEKKGRGRPAGSKAKLKEEPIAPGPAQTAPAQPKKAAESKGIEIKKWSDGSYVKGECSDPGCGNPSTWVHTGDGRCFSCRHKK